MWNIFDKIFISNNLEEKKKEIRCHCKVKVKNNSLRALRI